MTQDSTAQTPTPGAGHKRLDVFVGTWKTEGQQHAGPVGPAAAISAVETYEWLSGGFFLVHRFNGQVGGSDTSCIEIIGHDPQSQRYPTHTYYNNGLTNDWEYRERDGVWTLTGEWTMDGRTAQVRCTVRFAEGGDAMTGQWQMSSDGADWHTFWDVRSTRQT